MNRTRIFAALALLAAFVLPSAAFAQTVTSLETQIESMIAQIQSLESAASSTQPASTPAAAPVSAPSQGAILCPVLTRTLSIGDTGTDVANLQGFLAQNPLIYPQGTVSAYFGALTQAAVEKWQSAYGVVTSGTPDTTGYGVVGPKTRAAIQSSCAANEFAGPSCPVSPQPSVPCAGTWSPITNANGCTMYWQCAVTMSGLPATTTLPLSSATTTATTTTIAPAATTTSSTACEPYTLPLCQGGTITWLGMNNGCNLGYQCVQ